MKLYGTKKKTFHSLMHCCSIVMTVEQHFTPNCHDCNSITNILTFFQFLRFSPVLLFFYCNTALLCKVLNVGYGGA